jgi:hypothetical protein
MALYCPDCKKEILPYLRTGELKKIDKDILVNYQLYFCIVCKKVWYQEHEKYPFKNIDQVNEKKEENDDQENQDKGKSTIISTGFSKSIKTSKL